ncbi:hypothetical protein KUM39_02925 [Streptomyces sp. J2-1]|uniref:hypothetical protein n=1 Tax=Streptomyces corallincola TaxID=2851888 RepID=UPI001C38BB51|nr:hypothetical protein [Streptomyces corallincola]MBV2353323.1 hypothetical protein [Streptomyces corallincola]
MTLTIGIFDLFTYAVPGAVRLSLILYVLDRLGVTDPGSLATVPSALLIIGGAVASHLLGHLTYPLCAVLDKLAPRWNRSVDDARTEFTARVPEARDRPFVHADFSLLLAAVELHDKSATGEITRLRGLALMLRNSTLALAPGFALIVALVETGAGPQHALAGCCAALLLAALVAALPEGRRVRHLDRLKTLELAFWTPDIDENPRPGQSS